MEAFCCIMIQSQDSKQGQLNALPLFYSMHTATTPCTDKNQMNGTTTVPEQAIRKSFDDVLYDEQQQCMIITNCKCKYKCKCQYNLNTAREEMVPTLDTQGGSADVFNNNYNYSYNQKIRTQPKIYQQ